MDPLSIEDMKLIELDIMDEIDCVCAAHGVEYFMGYGTLLGAMRHGGFIPWDDDMDIVMMRDQYELLMDNFNDWRTAERFKLVSYRDGSSIYQFAKIVDTTTIVYENFVGKKAATGVWVDIFPLENYDPSKTSLLAKNDRWGLLRSFAVADPSVGSTFAVRLAKRIVCPIAKRFTPYKLASTLDELAREMDLPAADRVIDFVGEGNAQKTYPKSLFVPVRMKFENREYMAPAGAEEFLSIEYGDWRTPPAETDRAVHVLEAYRI